MDHEEARRKHVGGKILGFFFYPPREAKGSVNNERERIETIVQHRPLPSSAEKKSSSANCFTSFLLLKIFSKRCCQILIVIKFSSETISIKTKAFFSFLEEKK